MMATGKTYYWIKLKKDFLTSDAIDFLMSQKNGSQYVVMYFLLCMMCLNTDGKLENKIGEMIIPFDADKIQRDCKYFSKDTVMVAMSLFTRIGLVYEDSNGSLVISDYNDLVGNETDYAVQKRKQRNRCVDELKDNSVDIVHTEIRDEILEIRDKSLENREQSIESEKESESLTVSKDTVCQTDVRRILESWNSLSEYGISQVSRIDAASKRGQNLRARIKQYGTEKVLEAIENVKLSQFLQGKKKDFRITFDWFVKPNNFPKVLEGQYTDNENAPDSTRSYPHGSRSEQIANRIKDVDAWNL